MKLSIIKQHHWWWQLAAFLLLPRSFGVNMDGTLLLSFKYTILSDPFSVLDNWSYNDATPCSWTGVSCSDDLFRVVSLELPDYKLLGSIPQDLGFIPHLRTLDLSDNFLNGTLPASLFNASELQALSVSGNAIYGRLPESVAGMKSLKLLNLSHNFMSGEVPGGFHYVQVLDLSSNLLNGSLPQDFGGENLRYLNLSYNTISGLVSPDFAEKIPENCTIDISFNKLTGEIPESMAMRNQKIADGNVDLCGKPLKKLCTIPSTLSIPPNNLSTSAPAIAAIPKTIGDPSSAGTPQTLQPQHGLKPGAIAGIIAGDLAGLGALAIVFLYVYQLKKKNRIKGNEERTWPCLTMIRNSEETEATTGSDSDYSNNENHEKESSFVTLDGEIAIDLETLLKASAYILGSSGGSIVYKAVLEDRTAFAVRRIGESCVMKVKEFENQVKAIAKLRHPNLVRVRGFYWRGDDEKLVIYDYVSNGSLANVAGFKIDGKVGNSSPYQLPFEVRLKIAKGVAKGLAFIHGKKHVHGNIKPSNILLTPEMDPIIADFGLHWLLIGKTNKAPDKSSSGHLSTSPAGCTSRYHAPESLKDHLKPSPKWDVYSFGLVLLELLTGKMLSRMELSQWTETESVTEYKDRVLRMDDVENREESMLTLFKLGYGCASLDPKKRPSMKDAINVLERIPC